MTNSKWAKILFKTLLLQVLLAVNLIPTSCKRKSIYDNYKVDTIVPTGKEKYLNLNSDFIFDQNALHTFQLSIPTKDMETIDADPAAEIYGVGTLRFNGEDISPVGIRYKGSIGSFYGAVSGKDWVNPSGYKTATKISLKVKINWLDSSKTFYNLKKLQFHSQNQDPSQMHERLGYWLFREMGVIAPRSVHARLEINGIYYGVYALTEQIDERFIDYNFRVKNGNLYKEVWPLNHLGQAQDENYFKKGLKTNKGAGVKLIKDFANEIVESNNLQLKELIVEKMILDNIISYAVVDRMIRNDDGAFHWYCSENGCFNHNYYWYEEPVSKKLHLIPWDLDNAFENIGYGKNPVTNTHKYLGEISNNCAPFPYGDWGIYQKSATCDKLTRGWASFKVEYDSLKNVFINGPFSEERVLTKIYEWTRQIKEATTEARKEHWDALSEKEWFGALENLKSELKHSRENY